MCIVFKENIISLFENFTCYYKVLLPVLDFAMDIVDRKKNFKKIGSTPKFHEIGIEGFLFDCRTI